MRDSALRQLRQYASPGGPALIRFSHTHKVVYSRSFFPRVLENVDEPFANLDRKKPRVGRGRPTPVFSTNLPLPDYGRVARQTPTIV